MTDIKFTDIKELPTEYRVNSVFVVKCPHWCQEGYQICTFNGKEFEFDGQTNNMFMENIRSWAMLFWDCF